MRVGDQCGCRHSACTVLGEHWGCIASRTWSSSLLGRRVMRVSSSLDSLVRRNGDTLLSRSALDLTGVLCRRLPQHAGFWDCCRAFITVTQGMYWSRGVL